MTMGEYIESLEQRAEALRLRFAHAPDALAAIEMAMVGLPAARASFINLTTSLGSLDAAFKGLEQL